MAARGVEYGVGTRNLFDLLGDDDDGDMPKPKAVVKKDEPALKTKITSSSSAPKPSGNKLVAALPPVDEPRRAPRPDDRSQTTRANRDAARGGRGRRGTRGGAAGAGGEPGSAAPEEGGSRKREFDRRSAAGRSGGPGSSQKRDGGGAGNWGNLNDDVKYADEAGGASGEPRRGRGGRGRGRGARGGYRGRGGRPEDQPADAAAPALKDGEEAPKPEEGQSAEAPAAENAEAAPAEEIQEFVQVEDDEPKVKSYDEYLAEKEAKRVEEDLRRDIRQPDNEGEWRVCAPLAKDEEKEEEEAKAKRAAKPKKQAVAKLSLDQFVGTGAPRGRGGRGRGRGGRDGDREDRPFRANLDSEASFPSLKR